MPESSTARRHAEIYDSGMLPAFRHWHLGPRLLAGRNPLSEQDVLDLQAAGVTHVLDLREKSEWSGHGVEGLDALLALDVLGLERLNVPIPDYSPPSPEEFTAAADWLDEIHDRPDTVVYAHCRAGIQRTPTILGAWLARREGIDFDQALSRFDVDGYPGQPMPDQSFAARAWLAAEAKSARGKAPREGG